jgi:hypothetical protein
MHDTDLLLRIGFTFRAQPEKCQVTGIDLVTGLECDSGNGIFKGIRFEVQLRAAGPANQVVVIVPGQFIGQVAASNLGGIDNTVPGQKLQSAVDGGFSHTGLVDVFVDLCRGKMPTSMQGLQNGETLGSHAVSAGSQGLGVGGKAGHRYLLIAKIINNNYMQ